MNYDNPALVLLALAILVAVALVGLVLWGVRKPKRDYIPKSGATMVQPDRPWPRSQKALASDEAFRKLAAGPHTAIPRPVDPAKLTPLHKPGTSYGGEALDRPFNQRDGETLGEAFRRENLNDMRVYGGARNGGKSTARHLHSVSSMPSRRRSEDDRRTSVEAYNPLTDFTSPLNPASPFYDSPTPSPAPSYDPPACNPPPSSDSSGGIDFGSSSGGCSDGGW